MKKVIVYITPGFIILVSLFACHKYTSIGNGNGLPADMVATIDSVSWAAADSTQAAIVSQGAVTISGISSGGQEISITLDDTVIGLYLLNQTSASLAVYANLDSVGSYAYSTNQGSDTAQAGGTVNVTAINRVNKTISGIFSFKVYRNSDGSQKDITAGVFYNIPYADQ
jgi:hypothetical protein